MAQAARGKPSRRYEPLVEVVTDKVTMEVPSPVAGELLQVFAEEGETLPMGAPIAEVGEPGEAPSRRACAGDCRASRRIRRCPGAARATGPATSYLMQSVTPVGPTGGAAVEAMEPMVGIEAVAQAAAAPPQPAPVPAAPPSPQRPRCPRPPHPPTPDNAYPLPCAAWPASTP